MPHIANLVRITAVVVLWLAPVLRASAQGNAPPPDPLGRSTPRSLLVNFLRQTHDGNYATAAEYLESGRGPASPTSPSAQELARKLQAVLDRSLRIELSAISDDASGRLDDGLDHDREKIGNIETAEGSVGIILDRVGGGATPAIWLFSSDTLRRIPAIYETLAPSVIERYLPDTVKKRQAAGVALWRWLALVLLIPIAFGIAWGISKTLVFVASRFAAHTATTIDDATIRILKGPLHLFLGVALFHSGMVALGLPFLLRQGLGRLELLLAVTAVTWFVVRLVDLAAQRVSVTLVKTGRAAATSVVPLGRRIVKVVVIGLACLALLDNAGFDLKTVLAGLGVGGIAVALAAQKTLENLFGGLSIVIDQPVRVGDFCKFGDSVGTVVDVGLRSTRIRTLDRTVISVPNSQFASMNIENFGPREKVWFHPTLRLRIDTTPDQLRQVLADVRKLLDEHPKIEKGGHVRLIGATADGFNIDVFAYVLTANSDEFLDIQEHLLLRVLEIVEAAGTSLAVPAQLTFIDRKALDSDETQRADA